MESEGKNIAKEVSNILSAKRQRNILIIVILLLLTGAGIFFNHYSNVKTNLAIAEQNEKALSDSVRVQKNKIGDLEYSKNILIADKNNLKDLNSDLAEELEKEKGKVRELIKMVNSIESDTVYIENTLVIYVNEGGDTIYGLEWVHDTIYDAENERHIAGVSKFMVDSIGVIHPMETVITRDDIKFNLITGLREKDGNIEIFVRSDYPGFETEELAAVIIDPSKHPILKKFTKKKKFGIGPYVGLGLNVNTWPTPNVGAGFSFGIAIHYDIFRW